MKIWAQLAVLLVALVALWLSHSLNSVADTWWQSVLQNFGAGLCSALVLIWLYDRVLEHEAEKVRAERNRIAATQLVAPLRGHIYGVLFPMYRSAVAQKPDNEIKNWKEFLTINFPDQVQYLDVSIRSPGSYPEITPYPKFISEGFSTFLNEIQSLLNKYGTIVDAEFVDALEQVINNNFIVLGCGLEQSANFTPPSFPATFSVAKTFKFDSTMCCGFRFIRPCIPTRSRPLIPI